MRKDSRFWISSEGSMTRTTKRLQSKKYLVEPLYVENSHDRVGDRLTDCRID